MPVLSNAVSPGPPITSRTRWSESRSRRSTSASYCWALVLTGPRYRYPSEAVTQRVAAGAVGLGLGREHVVELDLVALEAQPRARHVEAPHPGGPLADLRDARVPVVLEVLAPGGERLGVVDPDVLVVLHLEAGVLHGRDDRPRADQLAVREHVAVDERAGVGRLVVRARDAVVEQAAPGLEVVVDPAEVRRVVLHPDVLGEADRGDRVEAGLLDVAVVHEPDLGEVVEPLLLDRLLRPRRLLARQRHSERVHAVLASGVADHPAPAAAEVEQPLPG